MRTLFTNALILDGVTAKAGNLLVDAPNITGVGDVEYYPQADQIIDASGCILMPALYNVHTHAAMTLMRGIGSDLALQQWLTKAIFPLEEKLTPQTVRTGTQLAMLEMLRFGTAGFADMYYHMDIVCKTAIEAGMNVAPAWASSIENQTRLLEQFGTHPQVRVFACIHAEYTTDEQEIVRVCEFADAHGLPIHVHVSETRAEVQGCLERHRKTPVVYLNDIGVFDRGGIVAHAVHTTDSERRILKEKGVFAAHCPISNLKLASGIMPIAEYIHADVPLVLGTDGCASNNTLNLFEEIRFSAVLHKGISGNPALLSPKEIFNIATRNGALACGFEQSGKICPGAQADLILLDISGCHAQPMLDPYVHIAYSAQGSDVRLTMVRGKILYQDGAYTTMDKQRVFRQANAWFKECTS